VTTLGGLGLIATVHVAAAWLFVAFTIMHIYLTTTGHTPLAHIRSMITGYESAPDKEEAPREAP
jgi:thiosulfate reductase cytochrome b subunit